MHMKRTMTLLAAAVLTAHAAHAQYVTYNHDSPKQNQITVMETGTGAFTPEIYYTLLHNKYKKTAAAKNKLSFRTLAGVNLYNQTDEAEAIDSALVKRAAVEALNVADRQVDLAWLAEGDKVNGQMERFRRNIDRILLCGGTPDERERWEEYYQVYQCAINATKDAYMPNAQRKKEYLRISEDVARQNGTLVLYLARKQNATVTEGLLNAEKHSLSTRKHPARCRGAVERIPVCRAWLADGWRQRRKRRRRNREQELKKNGNGRRNILSNFGIDLLEEE